MAPRLAACKATNPTAHAWARRVYDSCAANPQLHDGIAVNMISEHVLLPLLYVRIEHGTRIRMLYLLWVRAFHMQVVPCLLTGHATTGEQSLWCK